MGSLLPFVGPRGSSERRLSVSAVVHRAETCRCPRASPLSSYGTAELSELASCGKQGTNRQTDGRIPDQYCTNADSGNSVESQTRAGSELLTPQ